MPTKVRIYKDGRAQDLACTAATAQAIAKEAEDLARTHDDRYRRTVTDKLVDRVREEHAVEVHLPIPVKGTTPPATRLLIPLDEADRATIYTGSDAGWHKFGGLINTRGTAALRKLVADSGASSGDDNP